VLTDGTGRAVQTYQTDEFGNPGASQSVGTPISQPFGFAGEQQDPSGLDYLRARMYEPSPGRFVQRDSYGGSVGDPQSLNRYVYAASNPTTYTDPSGKCLGPVVLVCIFGVADWVLAGGLAALGTSAWMIQNHSGQTLVANLNGRPTDDSGRTLRPGRYAGESIPARGPERDWTPGEREPIDRIGRETGCHTCGSTDPKWPSGHFTPDHQPPSRLNDAREEQRLYPHCQDCSRQQGGEVNAERQRRDAAPRAPRAEE
jgi:RHS repeat-associated protein